MFACDPQTYTFAARSAPYLPDPPAFKPHLSVENRLSKPFLFNLIHISPEACTTH